MPDTSTEVAIATTTLGSSNSTITFSGIPGTYTDLRLVVVANSGINGGDIRIRLNGSSSTIYSTTDLYGDGASAGSQRYTSSTGWFIGQTPNSSSAWCMITADIFSYTGSTNKSGLLTSSADENGSGYVWRKVGLFQSTSSITSLSIANVSYNFVAGTTATLYGIL